MVMIFDLLIGADDSSPENRKNDSRVFQKQ